MNIFRLSFVLLTFIVGIAGVPSHAEQVTENAARAIAAQFMAQKKLGNIATAAPRMLRGKATAQPALYVFNAEKSQGWVIVSGEDRTRPVLGYSDKGNFDPTNVPENMQAWLDQYVEEIALLDEGVITIDRSQSDVHPKAGSAVSPLLTSQWDQGAPFNLQCPKVGSNYCVTGCVATAMAQIMYYHKWPTTTSQTIPSYHSSKNSYSFNLDALPTTNFIWSAMKNYYYDNETDLTLAPIGEVSKLMRYCGQSVKMDYSPNGSGASALSEVFVDYFRYSPGARKLFRFDYSYSQWESCILYELRANRPVMYGGKKHSGGHAFVCDGYDGNGYYHFNWGWRGNGDGYFSLTSLNPNASGIGSAVGNNGYVIGNYIIIGLEPNTVSTNERNSVAEAYNIQSQSTTYTRNSSSDYFAITVGCNYKSHTNVSRTYDFSWGIYDSTGFSCIGIYGSNPYNVTLDEDEYTATVKKVLSFGKNYGDGTYYLRPMCRESGGSLWLPCHFSGFRYIKAVINGNTLTLTPVNMVVNEISHGINGVSASFYQFSTVKKEDRPLEVTVKVTKTCLADNLFFYLWANDTLVGANAINLNGTSSGYVTISYTPTTAGTKNLKLTADKDGNFSYCTGSVDINPYSSSNLSFTCRLVDPHLANVGYAIQARTKIKNDDASVYNDYIFARLYKYTLSGSVKQVGEQQIGLDLSGGASVSKNFLFKGLEPGRYYVTLQYYDYNNLKLGVQSTDYQVGLGDVNGDGSVNAADVTALYNWILNSDDSSLVNGDQNDDNVINAADVTAVYNIILGQ